MFARERIRSLILDTRLLTQAVAVALVAGGCQEAAAPALPSAEAVETYYKYDFGLDAEVLGNVATIFVTQEAQQIRRGGALWAKVGPYVFLFTEETHQLFEDYPGLAGVRIVTRVGTSEVAKALLRRDELSGVLWRRSMNIAGRARREGTHRVTLLEDLVDWGEAHTEFEYNERYMRR